MIKEFNALTKKNIKIITSHDNEIKIGRVNAILANGQAQIINSIGQVSFAYIPPTMELVIGQKVMIQGNYIVADRVKHVVLEFEEYEV